MTAQQRLAPLTRLDTIDAAAVQVLNSYFLPSFLPDCASSLTGSVSFVFICWPAFNNFQILNHKPLFCAHAARWLEWGRFTKLTIFNSGYVCSFIMTTGKEHDNLCRRVCLPCASNYWRMRGARAGFVLKVNILYTQPYPALERFPLSTKWTSGYVSSDEVCAHRGGAFT